MNIGERLREERTRLGQSQELLGEAGGVRKQAQLKYESGERSPDAAYLERVAAVGVDVLYVLTGERAGSLPAGLSAEEQLLVESYRALPVARRKAVLADLLTGGAAKPAARRPAAGAKIHVGGKVVGQVAEGGIKNSGSVTISSRKGKT